MQLVLQYSTIFERLACILVIARYLNPHPSTSMFSTSPRTSGCESMFLHNLGVVSCLWS